MKEVVDKELDAITLLTESVAELTMAVKAQNDAIFCLLHNLDIEKDLPVWESKEEFEKEMGPKVKACIKAVGNIYGHSETDKG